MSKALTARGKNALAKDDAMPSAEDAQVIASGIRALAAAPEHAAILGYMHALASAPPQVLLLEGGSSRQRAAAGFYWAALLNCPSALTPANSTTSPCLACPTCLRFLGRMHRDLFLLDGSVGSIKIEEVREMRSVLGEAPREAQKRIVILAEAQSLTEAAANAMLKSLEEPQQGTAFVLLAPQRERLLPTLVSRSWVLTLAWPDPHDPLALDADQQQRRAEWETALSNFMRSGQGLLDRTGARGVADAGVAQLVLALCQKALAEALADKAQSPLSQFFAELPPNRQRMADALLAEAQDSLQCTVNPTLVVEWMAAHLFLLKPRR